MGTARLQPLIERLEPPKHTAHSHDRITPLERSAAVRGLAVHDDLRARKPFVRDADPQIGRLRNHGLIGLPAGSDGLGAETRVLLIGDTGYDHTARTATAGCNPAGSRGQHCRDAALHVLRATAVTS